MVRSPSAPRSAIPRRLRPISRWISIPRPSCLPLEMSRCLRSPVDAGSIPYSAVIHPRPLPAIQRGTDSWTDAVQITRVPPQEISADPAAVRTNPGSIVTGRNSSAARPPLRSRIAVIGSPVPRPFGRRALARPGALRVRASSRDLGELGRDGDVFHGAEGQLEEASAGGAQGFGVPGGEEPVLAFGGRRVAESAAAERVLDLAGDRGARADDLDAAAEHALEHRADQRVVGAAEDHG